MMSAFQTGYSAGRSAQQQSPNLSRKHCRRAAHNEVMVRRSHGIAHTDPEEEFCRGFVAGYFGPQIVTIPDGLTQMTIVSQK